MEQEILRRKWRWIGHTPRKPRNTINRLLNGTPRGEEREDGPETTGDKTHWQRWRGEAIHGDSWRGLPRTGQSGGLSSVAYVP